MRLAITRSGYYYADLYCTESRLAKKVLRERDVSVLAIDFDIAGRETGCDLIEWANRLDVLPELVVVIEKDRIKRDMLASRLHVAGFQSKDNINYLKSSWIK